MVYAHESRSTPPPKQRSPLEVLPLEVLPLREVLPLEARPARPPSRVYSRPLPLEVLHLEGLLEAPASTWGEHLG